MNKKTVIISPLDEYPSKVAVEIDLCSYYREIVEQLVVETVDDAEFEHQVALIVWGSFYIEAAMNKTLSMIVDDSVQGILAPGDVLDSLERSNVERKITLILAKLSEDKQKNSTLRKDVIELFRLRNKLVHPKEKSEKTDLTISNAKKYWSNH